MIAKTIQYRFYCSLLVLLLAFVFPLIFCFSEPEERSQRRHSLKSLQKFVGLDLDSVKENKLKELERALLQIDSTRTLNHSWAFGPHTIWDYYRMGTKPNYLICDCSKFNMHPGSTTIQLTHFDGNGIVHAKSKFTTGHRQYLDKAQFHCTNDNHIIVTLDIFVNLGGHAKQFYALIDDHFELIRITDEDGSAIRNCYFLNHGRCGPEPPSQTAEQWENDLIMGDRYRMLRTLTWLSGHHILSLPKDQPPHPQYEKMQEGELVREARARPRVMVKMKELADSDDIWLREAARLALIPEDANAF